VSSLMVLPMFAMVLLTASVLVVTFRGRVRAVREGAVPAGYYKVYQGSPEPDYAVKPARHFSNLFEAPVLFYVACLAAMVTDHAGLGMQALAWLYVAVRMGHAVVHLGRNRLRQRIAAYFASWIVLLALWTWLVVAVALSL
jgi:hypothetical protein